MAGSRTARGSSSEAAMNVREPARSSARQAARSAALATSGSGERVASRHHRVENRRRGQHARQARARDGCRRRRDRGRRPPRCDCAGGTRRSASAPAPARRRRRGTTSSRSWKSCGVSIREVTTRPVAGRAARSRSRRCAIARGSARPSRASRCRCRRCGTGDST